MSCPNRSTLNHLRYAVAEVEGQLFATQVSNYGASTDDCDPVPPNTDPDPAVGVMVRGMAGGSDQLHCCATLVAKDLALTAAHCLDDHNRGMSILIGGRRHSFSPVIRGNPGTAGTDLALVRLTSEGGAGDSQPEPVVLSGAVPEEIRFIFDNYLGRTKRPQGDSLRMSAVPMRMVQFRPGPNGPVKCIQNVDEVNCRPHNVGQFGVGHCCDGVRGSSGCPMLGRVPAMSGRPPIANALLAVSRGDAGDGPVRTCNPNSRDGISQMVSVPRQGHLGIFERVQREAARQSR